MVVGRETASGLHCWPVENGQAGPPAQGEEVLTGTRKSLGAGSNLRGKEN